MKKALIILFVITKDYLNKLYKSFVSFINYPIIK